MKIAVAVIEGQTSLDAVTHELGTPPEIWSELLRLPQDDADSRTVTLGRLTAWHAHVGNAAVGAGYGCAIALHWRRRIAQSGQDFVGSLGLADALTWTVVGLIRLGFLDKAIELEGNCRSLLATISFPLSAENLRTLVAEACLAADRPEDARKALPLANEIEAAVTKQAQFWGRAASAEHVEGRRRSVAQALVRLLEGAYRPHEPFMTTWTRELEETADMLEGMARRLGSEGAGFAVLAGKAREFLHHLPPGRVEALEAFSTLVAALVDATRTTVPGLEEVHPRLHAISVAIANDPGFTGTDEDTAWLTRAIEGDNEKLDGSWRQSCLWTISLLFERRGQFREANEALEALRSSLDAARSAASEPRVRAGLAAVHPTLAARLASTKIRSGGDAKTVIEAIEWGKGRWLGEEGFADPFDSTALWQALRDAKCHYLTMVVGEQTTCLALVTADGHASVREVLVGRADAELAVSRLLRRRGMHFEAGDWREPVRELLSWLPAPAAQSAFHEGDVLLLAPDGPFHGLPLHGLPCRDGMPLAPRMSLVRTHGAALVTATHSSPPTRPHGFLALRASTLQESGDQGRRAYFDSIVASLRDGFGEGTILDGVEADRLSLASALRPDQVAHLWAHGDALPGGTFYTTSGILLAHRGALPSQGAAAFLSEHLLSPQRALKLIDERSLSGSHVTLQACVSASAEANAQGDAIGLEWALLRAGAKSVLACHWHVSYRVAALFSTAFYRNWQSGAVTRAEAWRRATIEVAALQDLPSGSWAAMALTGDWR